MSERFEFRYGLIKLRVKVWGPSGDIVLWFALDTGATESLVNVAPLVSIGYDPGLEPERVQVTTGSNVEFVSRIAIDRVQALEQERINFPVLCHTLPTSAGVDGLLGLDFLRGQSITINFRNGEIMLS